MTDAPAQAGRPSHVAAASGLLARDGRLWVAADDEHALATFALDGSDGRWHALCGEELPLDPVERKAAKPDIESLALLPGGEVLALGSGSTERRERGWRVDSAGVAHEVDLRGLYAAVRPHVGAVNIEGAAVLGETLWLAQRGNEGLNALVACSLDLELRDVIPLDLGAVRGVKLTFSDLHPDGDALLFAGSAEDTHSAYHDGEVVGAAYGRLDPVRGEVLDREVLEEPLKLEGIARVEGRLLLVTDPDDDSEPAPLLEALR